MQIIRNEFVVSLEIVVADVEEDRSILALRSVFENPNRKFVAFEQRRKQRGYKRLLENFIQRFRGQERNQVGDEAVIGRRFDDHGQFHGGGFSFPRGIWVGRKVSV